MTATVSLDQPLPAELTGRRHGWLTEYRRYPVFSPAWVRGRLRLSGLSLGVAIALLALALLAGEGDKPWPGFAELVLSLAVPAFAGPWLAGRVRRLGLPPRREWASLVATILLVVAAMTAFDRYGAEPMKQWVAERIGAVDAQGKRKKVMMSIGVNISTPDTPPAAPMPGDPRPADDPRWKDDPLQAAGNLVTRALLSFWLAGGLALRGWVRERDGLVALEHERALARSEAERREAEMRLSVLAAQVEPHFLFNTLAGVRSAIATDPSRASEMIDRLVEYLRASIPRLRGGGVEQASVGAQFELVRAYLGLMATRMPRLSFTLECPADLLQARCPPLMLISLAENAVKHGVELKIGPAYIDVRAARTADGRLALTVEDDGVGFGNPTAGSGLGLTNIRERLAQLYGEQAALALKARPGGGVAATITLPLELP